MTLFNSFALLFTLLSLYIGLPTLACYGFSRLAACKSPLLGLLPIFLLLLLGISAQGYLLHSNANLHYDRLALSLANDTRAEVIICTDSDGQLKGLSDFSIYDKRGQLIDRGACDEEDFFPVTKRLLQSADLALPSADATAANDPAFTQETLYDTLRYLSAEEAAQALAGDTQMLRVGSIAVNRYFFPVTTVVLCGLLLWIYGSVRRTIHLQKQEAELRRVKVTDLS